MSRGLRWVLVALGGALVVAALVIVGVVAVGVSTAGPGDDGRGRTDPAPSPERVASALRFAALADPPPGAVVGPLRTEQGIDGLVVLRVRMAPAEVGPWLAASAMPATATSPAPVPVSLGPDLPPGTSVVPQHRAGRPGGGVVVRDGAVVGDGVLEIRAFET